MRFPYVLPKSQKMYCASDVPRSKMTDLRGGNSHGSSNGFCLRVHDGAIVVGFRLHQTDGGETAASLRTGQRAYTPNRPYKHCC